MPYLDSDGGRSGRFVVMPAKEEVYFALPFNDASGFHDRSHNQSKRRRVSTANQPDYRAASCTERSLLLGPRLTGVTKLHLVNGSRPAGAVIFVVCSLSSFHTSFFKGERIRHASRDTIFGNYDETHEVAKMLRKCLFGSSENDYCQISYAALHLAQVAETLHLI